MKFMKVKVYHHLAQIVYTRGHYNTVLVYCRELASGTVSLTGDRAQGDDNKHDSHYTVRCKCIFVF